jgi:lipopolysaccharide biosynthesis protein
MLLHPWLAPRRLAGIMKRGVIRLTIWVKRRQKARKALHEYKTVARTILRHKTTNNNQIAVILHLYYTDMWPYFRDKLRQLDGQGFDLYVSVAYGKESVAEEIKKTYPDVCVYGTPNHGRDVLPFLQTLQTISTEKYAYVLKLHSKKSKHRDDGNTWFTSIIEHLIPSEKIGIETLMKILQKDDTGIIGPAGEYMTLPVNYEGNKFYVRRLLGKLTSRKMVEEVDANRFDYGFFAGTMFWARLDAIEPALHIRRRIDDFALERGQIDGTVAHAYERIFCLLPELQGRSMYEIGGNQVQQIPYKTDYAPEWSDVYEPISTTQD